MHICHITSMHQWDDDRIFERACRSLAANGFKVTLIAVKAQSGNIDGVDIIGLKSRSGIRRRLLTSRDALKAASDLDCDIFHFHDPDLLPWMLLLRRKGKRIVYDSHEDYSVRFYQWNMPGYLRAPLAKVFRMFERFTCSKFQGLVVPDTGIREVFTGKYSRCAIVRNTHDLTRLAALTDVPPKDKNPVLYTSGSNLPDRNCLEMVRALPMILKQIPDAILRLAGYFPEGYSDFLRENAIKLGVESHLELLGPLPYLDHFKRSFRAHVGCVFLKDTPKNHNANSNRLFEYMYCGIPVIAENLPGPRSVVEYAQCGILIDSSKPEQIAEAFIHLIQNPEKASEMGANGRRAVMTEYNYEKDFQELKKLYENIMDDQLFESVGQAG